MNVKKVFSQAFAFGLALTLTACGGSNKDDSNKDNNASNSPSTPASNSKGDAEVDNFKAQTNDNTLVVGVDSIGGEFIQGFNNGTNDVTAREFMGIQGAASYDTYIKDRNGKYNWNPTVLEEEPKTVKNDDGSSTTTFKLKKDLKWSDGEAITVDDYLFKSLLHSSKDYSVITGSTEIGADSIKGYNDYREGKTDEFVGLKKIDDNTFEATIDSSFLPYFEEEYLKAFNARPIHYIAPNLKVEGSKLALKDGYELSEDDKKAYIESLDQQIKAEQEAYDEKVKDAGEEDADAKKEHEEKKKNLEDKKSAAENGGDIDPTKMLVEQAMIFDANDYRKKPAVTCGPYKFVSFENNMVKLALNENYAGDFEGHKATIPNVIIQAINTEIAVDLVKNGDIDIYEQEMNGSKIDQMRKAADEGKLSYVSYDRNGYGCLKFLTDRGPTQYKEVRQAIAFLMDRNDFVQNFAGGYAVVTNGMYGSSQWMYKERGADVESKLTNYTLNIDEANKRLDASPYKFEKDGKTPWDAQKAQEQYKSNASSFDYYRYDENGKKLQINQFGAKQSEITTLLSNQLPDNAKQAGLEYNVQAGDFNTLLNYMYNPKEGDAAEYTAFNMGNGFGTPFDPYYQYNSKGNDNTTKTNDPKADEITVKLRQTDPSKKDEYLDRWEEFQQWYNDYLPEIPLYSNQVHSAASSRVEGFEGVTPEWGVSCQINQMSLK
ncbi:ABC transporter substrate-binding protein [Anaerococcus porci]|uniref:ABC transporter substrate-binding protein n=1 Tax=Anaerococcus porci TaxID=2652269 RepID=A0A6N7VDR6_9FIRM|nr:ABC transporter substrate-binding protein [Anaerococcus porci]MDY3005859.1 ABC transporter substrate-binding protein [Anaerococcus porci]MSS77600.1 ABC transporter substrate-binding protein [Anaerococcus porci]